jgi:hypothetical protein
MAGLKSSENLANRLIKKYKLDKQGWTFKWDYARTRFGLCDYGKKTIQLSTYLTQAIPMSEVKDTLLHEIAHALTPNDGGHGKQWMDMCVKIGAKPERCKDVEFIKEVPQLKKYYPKGRSYREYEYNASYQKVPSYIGMDYYKPKIKSKKQIILEWCLEHIVGGLLVIILLPYILIERFIYQPISKWYYKRKNSKQQYFYD